VRAFVRTRATQTALTGIPVDAYLETPVPVPTITEQYSITEILDAVERTIRDTDRLISKLKAMKAGLLHDLLTKGVDENGELRDPVAHPEKFKESPLGSVPKAWEVRHLAEITLSAIDGPFGSNLKTEHYVDQPGIRVVRLQNIGQGHFEDTDKAYISEKHAETLKRYRVVPGDLIIASLGDENHPIARACVYPADEQPGIVKADCFRFRLDISKAHHEYLMHVLNSPWTRTDVLGIAQGVTRDRVNLTNVKKIRIRVPPASEQSYIVDIVKSLDSRLKSEESDLDKFKHVKKGLTEDLLTGRVRVENPHG
jgi:type I restriction enzyme S subunit